MEEKKSLRDVKMNQALILKKALFIVVLIILAGIATRVIPQGSYERMVIDGREEIVEGSFRYIDGDRLPVWRWITAPFEAFLDPGAVSVIVVMLFLLVMGGVFVLLDDSRILLYLVTAIISRFGKKRFLILNVMVFVLMAMGSTLSFYDQAAVILPLALGLCFALGWDSLMAMGMSVLPIGFGFACSTTNPFTVGIPQTIAQLPMYSGLWLRLILFGIVYVILLVFLRSYARKIEKNPEASVSKETDRTIRGMFPEKIDTAILENRKVRKATWIFCGSILLSVCFSILSIFVRAINGITMPFMMLCLCGGILAGAHAAGYAESAFIWKEFFKGMKKTASGVIVIFLVMGIRQIIVEGNIMDTLLYEAYQAIEGMSPYLAILVILGITMLMEFAVGSASTKAFLLLPMLVPLGNMIGLTSQTIVQSSMFGDSFTNMFYPTSTMILLTTSAINLPLSKWYRWTWKLILAVAAVVVLSLMFCVAIQYGPY
ncbi:MAG TPA: hypothetical protein H9761_10560 [Candidatus Eisenbergiella merdavium]|uniref:YfcC family protein n=1 Tax=Candidatus Eisenbergiella merdavium TaxID=2838551 RepID=A0A9D2SRG0_9FIRM|nr:hypothetical protein [Candidatus Eisenbergiella merdavium]